MARRNTGGRLRALIFLLISFAAAGIASVVIFLVIKNYQDQLVDLTENVDQTVQVMVAARDLSQGRTIVVEDLEMKELPPEYVPESVLSMPEEAVGRVPRERILMAEFIREERLADPESGIGLNAIIPKGMRALAINISDGSAVSGFLNPGNYVDVLVTVKAEGTAKGGSEEESSQTITLLQAVTVLAVNNRLGTSERVDSNDKPSVTLAVTPDLAEKLTHAIEQGDVTLSLRNDIDVTHVETHGALTDHMLGGDESEGKRITIKQYNELRSNDGTLVQITGGTVKTVKVKNNP